MTFDVEQHIARHGGALRQLARELVGGDAADDVVQETWLRVLRNPPRHTGGIGGWLATILRNVAFRSRRGEQRRLRREHVVATARVGKGDGGGGDDVGVLVRAELAHRLLAAVEALEPHYREAIWQRWFEGTSPQDIAAQSGVPVATVKSRLQRGLGMLRARLGEKDGGAWRAGLAAAFGLQTVATGAIMTTTWAKVAAGGAIAAALFAALLWWPRPDDVAPRTDAAVNAPIAVRSDLDADAARASRESVAGSDPVPAAAPAAPAAATGIARVRGRVIDAATKAPIEGALVLLRRSFGIPAEPTDLTFVTREDGAFVFEFDSEWKVWRLWFRAADHVLTYRDVGHVDAGQDDDVGDAALTPGRALAGRVVDEAGAPLPAGTLLHVMFGSTGIGGLQRLSSLDLRTGLDGAFVCEPAVPLGKVTFEVGVGPQELKHEVVVTAAEPAQLTLVARRRLAIRGVVVDGDKAPIADVQVAVWAGGPKANTSADGSFTLLRPNNWTLPAAEIRVEHAPEFRVSHTKDVPWDTHDLRLVLTRTAPLPIEVVDDAGAPVEEFGVVLMRDGTEKTRRGTVLQRGVHAGGRLAVDGVDPGRTSLRVVPVDPRLTPSACVDITSADTQRFVLARRVPCTVEVRLADKPVAGARVEVVSCGPEGVRDQSALDLLDPHVGPRAWTPAGGGAERVAEARTDANGIASLLRDAASGRCSLQVHVDGRPPFVVRDVVFPARVDVPGIGTIEGRVELRGRHRSTAGVWFRGAVNLTAQPQPDGTYRSPPLAAGTWSVSFAGIEASARDVEVRDGETAVVDFDFAAYPPAEFHGRIVRNGALPPELTAELLRVLRGSSRPSSVGKAPVAADGSFVIGDLQAGTYRLALRGTGNSSLAMPTQFAESFVIGNGEHVRVELPLPPRRLVVILQRADGSSARGAKVLTRCDGVQWPSFAFFAAPSDGTMVFDPAPMLPVEFAEYRNDVPVWSAPIVMPPDRAEAEITVVLP